MAFTLALNAKGPEVARLQRALDRIGSMLLADGDFGPATRSAVLDARAFLDLHPGVDVADDELVARLEALPEPSAELTAAGVTFIGREEVSSPGQYRLMFARPVWPSAQSGITIGIGYDLMFSSRSRLDLDWGQLLDARTKDRLAQVCGRVGSQALLRQVRDVEIALPAAMKAFTGKILPDNVRGTRGIYPQLDALPPWQRTALVSLVYNRGAKVSDNAGSDRRREMRAIQELLRRGRFDEVPAQLRSMKRLWNAATEGGVIARREREASLFEQGFAAQHLV